MSDKPKDGGPAFPKSVQVQKEPGEWTYIPDTADGMSLRDYFAAHALSLGWEIEKGSPTGPYSESMEPSFVGAARRAYLFADAMLKERDK